MTDRRDPRRQIPVPGGGRATDPPLTTRACAEWMGVTTEYIRGAIKDGQLAAERVGMGGRKMHRIHLEDFIAYLRLIGWKRIPRFPCVPGVDATSIIQPTEPTQPTE